MIIRVIDNGNSGIVPPWLRDPKPWKPLVVDGPSVGKSGRVGVKPRRSDD